MTTYLRRLGVCLVVLLFGGLGRMAMAADIGEHQSDALLDIGISVTKGAAAGYVPDAVCGECHADKAESFADVGMAKSFFRPSPDRVIEDFENNHFHHQPSNRHYEMELHGDEYWFRRYRLARDGRKLDVFERKVDWILGSGNHTRVYLYQTADGAMFQLPLGWYSRDRKWEMAPGFEWKRHLGVMRTVRRQCMFCHNAYPDVEAGSDLFGMDDLFPHDLPGGIGCQRCHGPGARHVSLLHEDETDLDLIRSAIVNPAKLPRENLYSICYGCHMQPAVAMTAVRKFGRQAYSFRPGELLSDFRVDLDIKERDKTRIERFEINHHPYRLEQSRCFVESEGKLGCLTCHDPHVKRTPEERASHYREACLSCHGDGDGNLEIPSEAAARHPSARDGDDCTTCHMPERRTQDVIHVTMTDHLIAKNPGGLELIAPIEKKDADIEEVFTRLSGAGMSVSDETIYRAVGVLRYSSGSYADAADSLEHHLRETSHPKYEPWLELAWSHLKRQNFAEALAFAREAAVRAPEHPKIKRIEAAALYALGQEREGIATLENQVNRNADQTFRLAVMKSGVGEDEQAIALARAALEQRDNLWTAWRLIGEVELNRKRYEAAASAFFKALTIEPDDDRNRDGVVKSLTALGRADEAADYGK